MLVAGFVAWVVLSGSRSSIPVGAQGSMPGMAMPSSPGGGGSMTLRDIAGRTLRVPGGRAGAVVFAAPRNCEACLASSRAARAAAQRNPPARLVVVMADPATSREEVRTFAAAVGGPPARYVVDDRSATLAGMYDPPGLGGVVVFDRRGSIVERMASGSARRIAAALRRAGG